MPVQCIALHLTMQYICMLKITNFLVASYLETQFLSGPTDAVQESKLHLLSDTPATRCSKRIKRVTKGCLMLKGAQESYDVHSSD